MKWQKSVYYISRIREEIHNLLVRELKFHGIEGLVPSHGDIIAALRNGKTLTMTEIAEKISRDRSTVTTLVNKLVAAGYVITEKNPDDKRSSFVKLTAKGEGTREVFRDISDKMFSKIFKDMTEEERESFSAALENIFLNLKE